MDDISICGPTTMAELDEGKISSAIVDTQWLGVGRCPLDELRGGDSAENAGILEGILSGEIKGAKRDLTIANAAGGFVVARGSFKVESRHRARPATTRQRGGS